MRLFFADEAEMVKVAVHGSLLGLAGLCVAYNAIAYCLRGERHLACNVALYGALVAFECRKCRHHLGARC